MAKLERVLGCTACSSSIATDEITGLVAYPCGSTVVISNPKGHTQAHLISTSKNNITTLAFSPCGRYVATGEFGCDPLVRVWELQKNGQSFGQQVAELKDHKIGIMCVIFSKDSKQVISVGNQHDKSVVVWDWRAQRKITESRLSSQVYAIDMNDTGKMFVTVGSRHVKFWFLESVNQLTTLQGRSAILSDQRNNTFISVCCAPGNRTFALTIAKQLIEFHDKKLTNIYEMDGGVPYSLTIGMGMLIAGFSNGRIMGFDLNTVEVAFEVPLPHYLKVDLSNASNNSFFENTSSSTETYPDVHALAFHERTRTLTAFYSDRSIYHWQVLENGQFVKISSHLFHVSTIHDVCIVKNSQASCLPAGSFFTCGADETVRLWNIERDQPNALPMNVLSNDLRSLQYLSQHGTNTLTEQHGKNFGGLPSDAFETTVGIRCMCLNYDGKHLAVGSRNGNITIFDLTDLKFRPVCDPIEAHESEIRCLEYSDPSSGHHFLASGSRDRLVHLFNVDDGYSHLSVIEDHPSTVYSISFSHAQNELHMITASTDKLVIVRKLVEKENNGVLAFERVEQINIRNGPNYLVMTPERNLLTAGNDRHLRTYTLNGKEMSDVNGTLCDSGTLTKVALDPSGTFAATVCSDRYVYVVDVASGDCVAVLSGQSDGITAIEFTNDCRRLIVVSFSGGIFVWRLSTLLTKRMLAKLNRSSPHSVDQDRCATPDSLIESGSDSASAIVSKKDAHAASSEFGSLNSLNVAQEDDLDSGVGLRPQPPIFSNRIQSGGKQKAPLALKRIPAEVVRRSNSNLHNALAVSTDNLHQQQQQASAEHQQQTPPADVDPASPSPQVAMLQNAGSSYVSAAQPVPFPTNVAGNYATSRSMSNLHRHAVSPQRRRRWNVPAGGVPPPAEDQSFDGNYSVASPPAYALSPVQGATNTPPYMMESPTRGGAAAMGSSPYNAHNNDPLVAPRFSMNTSISLNTLRSSLAAEDQQSPLATSSPRYGGGGGQYAGHPQQQRANVYSPHNQQQPPHFDRNGHSRNSISKRYLNHPQQQQQQAHTVWAPNELKPRHNSSLFNASTPTSRRYDPQNGEMPAASATADMYNKTLRSRSQSPSQLALQLAEQQSRRLSSTLQRRRESESRSSAVAAAPAPSSSSRLTPASSRTNLRAASNLANSSQALHKLLASRDQLKKSQENLLLATAMADDDEAAAASLMGGGGGAMSRSRSIGNLKLTTARPARATHNNTFGGGGAFDDDIDEEMLDPRRKMARSVSSLHNTATSTTTPNSDEMDLRSQYGGGGGMSQSIRNLHKLSNPDLTAGFDSSARSDEPTAYQSTTLPKSLRKGAVQKRLERNNGPQRLRAEQQQTTSGESDGSDVSPMSVVKKGTVFQRANQFRSISSVDGPINARARSSNMTTLPQKTTNYLAQRFKNGVEISTVNEDPSISEIEMHSPNAKNMKMHARDCVDQMKNSCDKLLHAKQMIANDPQLTEEEREKLLRSVYKAINQFRQRLENALPEGRFSDISNVDSSTPTAGGSGSLRNTASSSGRPSSIGATSGSGGGGGPASQLDEDFIKRYGPQLMELLQKNIARNN